eukprot:152765-Karenia_brevis.AAC.1
MDYERYVWNSASFPCFCKTMLQRQRKHAGEWLWSVAKSFAWSTCTPRFSNWKLPATAWGRHE